MDKIKKEVEEIVMFFKKFGHSFISTPHSIPFEKLEELKDVYLTNFISEFEGVRTYEVFHITNGNIYPSTTQFEGSSCNSILLKRKDG